MKRIPPKTISAFPVRSMIVLAVLLAGAAFLFSLQPAHAATTYTVNTLADSDDGSCTASLCSLRDAITAAEANAGADVINFSVTGTITLGDNLPSITNDLTIDGPGASLLTVSGNNSVRVFSISAAGTVTFSQLTISNGFCYSGYFGGGGINATGTGTVNVTNVTLSGNSSNSNPGGAIDNYGTLNLINSTLSGNSVSNAYGGAIHNQGTLNVTNSALSGNSTSPGYFGGAIANDGTATIDSSTLSGNSAQAGGAILNNGVLDVIASTVSNNTGVSAGGGIASGGLLNVTNSTLSGNSAGSGGGIYAYNSPVQITSSTISGNSAGGSGGGILSYNTSPMLDSDIVALNTAGTSGPDLSGVITSQGHNVVGDSTGSTFAATTGDQVGVTATQLNLGPLANNNGPTQTMALGTGSVAINNGDDAVTLPPLSLTTDQRGPGYARKSGTHVDAGAFEVQQANAPTNKDQCKNGGWRNFDTPRTFKNQGDCIQFVNTGK